MPVEAYFHMEFHGTEQKPFSFFNHIDHVNTPIQYIVLVYCKVDDCKK